MRKKKNSPLDDVMNAVKSFSFDDTEQHEEVTMIDGIDDDIDDVDDLEQEKQPDSEEQKAEESDAGNEYDDDSKIPQEVLKRIKNSSTEEEALEEEIDENVEEVDPGEAQQIGAFFDAFAEALDWDVKDDEKPTSIESLIDYIGDVVEQNSTPKYADQRIADLDEYVKNGGRFEDYYNNQSQLESYSDLDMEDEANQKAVVRDYMKLQGYTDDQISRKIERYEDADMLEDEATDAVEYLKRIREHQLQQALEQQQQLRLEQEWQSMQFINDLNTKISSLDNIRGINIPKADRKALYDYITKVDADGLTQYQKDFNDNIVSNLIESAYFTMKGDALIGSAKRNGQTSAANKLRTMLKHQTKNHSSYNVQEEKAPQAWEIASKFL